ncbi:MAG: hypothetical protein CMM25_09085 [Rhodospirillaceae bacterium]|nr:hypothetical protein [Rhodospirillaceae bacterium]
MVFILAAEVRAKCNIKNTVDTNISGFQEVIINVSDMGAALDIWQNIGGYKILCQNKPGKSLKALWGLSEQLELHQVLLRKANAERGFVRLVEIPDINQRHIRSSGMPWDTGGYFDLYVYVDDVNAVFHKLRQRGWQAYSDPINYTLMQFDITEVIMRGPNGEVLCLMQRNAPPYDQGFFGSSSGMGWPFNIALVVTDYEAHEEFFLKTLGWYLHINGSSLSPPPGFNPLGLPSNLARSLPRRFAAFAPSADDRTGSLQILSFEGLEGQRFEPFSDFPNLGIVAVRIPVDDLSALERSVMKTGYPIHSNTVSLFMEPYGEVSVLVLKAPNGARIEFFEPLG